MRIYNQDCLIGLKDLPNESIDLLVTDPPYGIKFMSKSWDRALPDKNIWVECFRVLKAGSFAFVMSIPRADCLSRMIISLEDAGFWVNFTPIFWAYASGFPKSQNISKAVDKRLGTYTKGELLPTSRNSGASPSGCYGEGVQHKYGYVATSAQAKALDGSYGGFQPKPAVEVIIVAMKPLSEKTFIDQALKNKKGITWLDNCRIPYESEGDKASIFGGVSQNAFSNKPYNGDMLRANPQGRFPANLLVSDDVLNDGRVTKSGFMEGEHIAPNSYGGFNTPTETRTYDDSGSFSRYFDLDKWTQKTFPFLIVPKASKGEKNKGLEGIPEKREFDYLSDGLREGGNRRVGRISKNNHPAVKPIKLMSYLITLGSREGDLILDPFMGTGTTGIACQLLNRQFIGYEIDKDYFNIAQHRLNGHRRMI